MVYIFIAIIFILLLYYKSVVPKYYLDLPVFLLIFDFIKILPFWNNISGYNGIELLILFFFMSDFILSKHWFRLNILDISLITFILISYYFSRTSFNEQPFNYLTRVGITAFIYLLFPIFANHISKKDFKLLIDKIFVYLKIFAIITIAFSLLKIGPNMYKTGLIYGLEHDQLNAPALALVFLWFFNSGLSHQKKQSLYFITIIVIIIFFLTFKRTPLVIIFIGSIVYALFLKKLVYKISILSLLIFAYLSSIIIYNNIENKREDFFEPVNVEQEGRFIELESVYYIITENSNTFYFGNGELYNTRGKYGFRQDDRPIHSYYGELLLGSGFVGLFLFFLYVFYINIKTYLLIHSIGYKKFISLYYLYKNIVPYIIASTLILFFTAFVGPIRYIGYNALLFLLLGSSFSQILFAEKYELHFSYRN